MEKYQVAFVPALWEVIEIGSEQSPLKITVARRINFESYKLTPEGEYTKE